MSEPREHEAEPQDPTTENADWAETARDESPLGEAGPEIGPESADAPDVPAGPGPESGDWGVDAAGEAAQAAQAAPSASSPAGIAWGAVDEDGNVRLRNGPGGAPGRIVGKVAEGTDPAAALGHYALRFEEIVVKVDTLEQELEREPDRSRLIGRIHSMLDWVPRADALGDFDLVLERLRRLEGSCQSHLEENLRRKEELCARTEAFAGSTDWSATAEAIQLLQSEWKTIGPVPRERSDDLWARFRQAANEFFERRKAHFSEARREHQENLRRKLELCEKVEALAASTDWNATAEAIQALQAEWKTIGPVPRERSEAVWTRFRQAANEFFERRKAHFADAKRVQQENLKRKQELCEKAEALASSTDWKPTSEAMQALQAEWKATGPVPRKHSETLWKRFRGAMDAFYARRAEAFEERARDREERRSEWRSRLQETLERKHEQVGRLRESVQRDEDNLERWRGNLATVRQGPRAAEMRAGLEERIAEVEARRASKLDRLAELEGSIRELEAKLGQKPPRQEAQSEAREPEEPEEPPQAEAEEPLTV